MGDGGSPFAPTPWPDVADAPFSPAAAPRAQEEFVMNRFSRALRAVLVCSAILAVASPVLAQDSTAIVSLYRVAPGKHAEFLKWMAAREATAKQAGAQPTQWYAHLDGDSWDYIAIAPDHDPVRDGKADAIARQQGLAIGMKASLELRGLMASHTDTIAAGPFTAEQLVQEAGKP